MIIRKFAAIFLIIGLFSGCDPDGRTGPTRTACEIEARTDGNGKGWFAYIDYAGDRIDQPGLRMERIGGEYGEGWYFKNNGLGGLTFVSGVEGIWIEDTGVTGDGGILSCYGVREDDGIGRMYYNACLYSKPNTENCVCSAQFNYVASLSQEASGASGCTQAPTWLRVRNGDIVLSNLLESERVALLDDSPDLPGHGFSYSTALVQQKGGISGGVTETVGEGFVATNLTDVDLAFRYAAPMMYSFTLRTSEPVDLNNRAFVANIKTDSCANDFPVELRNYASNEENTVHVLRTEYFLLQDTQYYSELTGGGQHEVIAVYDRWSHADWYNPNDPNTYDGTSLDISEPNFIVDEMYDSDRVRPCYIIPIEAEDDYVEVTIEESSLFGVIGGEWLSDNKLCDMNNDGIVNLRDWFGF
jgi:hypothetical protein